MTDDQTNPAEALAAMRRSRAALGDRLEGPGWYLPVYSLGAGGIPASIALDVPWTNLALAAFTILILLSHRAWVRHTGVSVLGVTPRRARWVAFGLGAVLTVIAGLSFYLKMERDLWWGPLALAPLAFAAGWLATRLWLKVYRAELAEGA